MTNKNVYDAFVEKLVEQLGFTNVSEPQKSKLIDSIKQRVEARVLRVLATSLTSEQNKELSEKVKRENLNEEEIIDYLVKNAPNASTAITRAMEDLYTEMKEETDTLMQVATVEAVSGQKETQPPAQTENVTQAPPSGAVHTRTEDTTASPAGTNQPTPPVSNQYY